MRTMTRWATRWARNSNEVAIGNARAATTECSRRRVERDDVALFLSGLVAEMPVRLTEGADSLSG